MHGDRTGCRAIQPHINENQPKRIERVGVPESSLAIKQRYTTRGQLGVSIFAVGVMVPGTCYPHHRLVWVIELARGKQNSKGMDMVSTYPHTGPLI